MIGFRCECGVAIDCTYPKCNAGVEVSSKDITERLRDYARDYTTTTYHDDLIREAVTEIEYLRQQLAERDKQVTLLRDELMYIDQCISNRPVIQERIQKALEATNPKEQGA